jgi:hypothetical protein
MWGDQVYAKKGEVEVKRRRGWIGRCIIDGSASCKI